MEIKGAVATAASVADAHFWQAFLSADLSSAQRERFFADLHEGVDLQSALRSWSGLTSAQRKRLQHAQISKVDSVISRGAKVLSGSSLPDSLLHVPSAPSALFAWGNEQVLNNVCISVVGTRRASSYGRACSHKFSFALAKAGATIVSGGALGIDTEAHRGAVEAGGKTAVVFGTGIDQFYPSTNHELYKAIIESGVLLSPFAVGTPSYPDNFLKRNPIVAALSQTLLVIEAPDRSGSLSTATAALDLGRDVYVVPGPITLESFRGSHQLIREGATLIDHPDQLLDALGLDEQNEQSTDLSDPLLDAIMEHLGGEPKTGDHLVQLTGLDTSEVLSALTMLELEGAIRRDGTGYIRA